VVVVVVVVANMNGESMSRMVNVVVVVAAVVAIVFSFVVSNVFLALLHWFRRRDRDGSNYGDDDSYYSLDGV
jgi:hypothetical protein